MSYSFMVKGSNDTYSVSIAKNGSNLIATCTCNAAKNGMACKHRLNILQGNSSDVISSNAHLVKEIPSFIEDTLDGQLLMELLTKEAQLEQLKIEVPKLKKQLARILPI